MPQTFLAFNETPLFQLTERKLAELRSHITTLDTGDIAIGDESDLVNALVSQYTLEAPEIDFDQAAKTSSERAVEDTSGFGAIARASGGARMVRRQVITYHLRVKHGVDLLKYRGSSFSLSAPIVYVLPAANGNHDLCFDVVRQTNGADPQQVDQDLAYVRQQAEQNISQLRNGSQVLAQDIANYNEQLRALVPQLIATRKKRLQDDEDFLGHL